MLETIIALIIFIPVVLFVLFWNRKDWRTNVSAVMRQILGNFLLVFGLLLLFPAFYALFHGKDESFRGVLLAVSLVLVFGGYFLTHHRRGAGGKFERGSDE